MTGDGTRAEWVDLRAIHRLAERVARATVQPLEERWDGTSILGRHWRLAEFDWHRRRTEEGAAVTHHQVTRYALLPDGGLVRADRSSVETGDEAGGWTGRVRDLTERDVRALDAAPAPSSITRGGTTTWGVQPTGARLRPWAGGGIEQLLAALLLRRSG